MNKQLENDEIEIDLKELFLALKKKIWIILGAFIAGTALMAVYTIFLVTPVYSASSMMYVLSTTTSITSLSDLQLGTQLTNDYVVLIKSRPVIEQVIENLGLNMTYGELNNAVSVTNQTDTRILTITVKSAVPETAQKVADELASVTATQVAEIMGTEEPNVFENATLPTSPVSPSLKKNCILGGIAGLVLACAVVIVMYLMNDSIKSEEDVEKYLGLTTLGIIPEKAGKSGHKKKNRGGSGGEAA